MTRTAFPAWRYQVSQEMIALVNGWDSRRGTGVRSRAGALLRCIRTVRGQKCRCGAPMEQSGEMLGEERCHARSCPRCGRLRQASAMEWFSECQKLIDAIDKNKETHVDPITGASAEHKWRLLTITTRYDPYDKNDLTVAKIEERFKGVKAAFRSFWGVVRDGQLHGKGKNRKRLPERSGAFTSAEIGKHGAVHLHALMYCRWIDNDDGGELERALQAGYPDIGEIGDVRIIKDPMYGAAEVTKYSCKTPGQNQPSWMAAAADPSIVIPKVISPLLAARWEVATWGKNVHNKYGIFRAIKTPDLEHEPRADRMDESCSRCGVVGDWFEVEMPVAQWALLCLRYNMRPFGRPATWPKPQKE